MSKKREIVNKKSLWSTIIFIGLSGFMVSNLHAVSKIEQLKNSQKIKKSTDTQTADMIIISENNPKYLHQMVDSIFKYVNGIDKIFILKDPCYGKYRDLYENIKSEYQSVEFIKVAPSNFKSMLESLISLSDNEHVILSRSNIIFTDYVDLDSCIKIMNKKNAQGFYFGNFITKNILQNIAPENEEQQTCDNTSSEKQTNYGTTNGLQDLIDLDLDLEGFPEMTENIFMWQFKSAINSQALNTKNCQKLEINNLKMTLYSKNKLLNILQETDYNSPCSLEENFNSAINSSNGIYGLGFSIKKTQELKN